MWLVRVLYYISNTYKYWYVLILDMSIRSGAIAYMCALAKQLEPVDVELWFLPKLNRYLQSSLASEGLIDFGDPTEVHLALRPPLPRVFLDHLVRFSLLDHLLEKLRVIYSYYTTVLALVFDVHSTFHFSTTCTVQYYCTVYKVL